MWHGHSILFWTYVINGPLIWLGAFLGMAIGWTRVNRLLKDKSALPENSPHVTILVPAKDEEGGIADCIRSIAKQDYPSFDILAVDDRSEDRTGAILDELAREMPQLRVLHIEKNGLPPGWLGKCHALSKAEKMATGEWLFFVDSDVQLQPDALRKGLALCVARKYDALSIITRLICHTFWEKLMLPLLGGAWTMMYFVSLTNRNNSEVAVANGQFFLIRREAYEKVGGHAAVRNQITEDVELMRLLKSNEFIVRFLVGGHLASARMHVNLHQMFHGWGRIFSGTGRRSPWRILAAMSYVLFNGLSVYVALVLGAMLAARGEYALLIVSLIHMALMTLYLAAFYALSGNQKRYAWLFPVSGVMMLAIFAFALRKCYETTLNWRGTTYGADLTETDAVLAPPLPHRKRD